MNSLRQKLIAGLLTGLTFLLGAGGTAAYVALKKRLYLEFDHHLSQRAVLLASMIEWDAGVISIEWLEESPHPPGYEPGLDSYAIWSDADGRCLAAAPEFSARSLPGFGGSFQQPEIRVVELPGGQRARAAGIEFDARHGVRDEEGFEETSSAAGEVGCVAAPGATRVRLVLARADTVAPMLGAIRWPLIGLWAGCTAVGGAWIRMVVRRSLKPLDELQAQIGALKEGRPGQRIRLSQPPAELEPVARELNQLLERVDKVMVRERTLTSNVAHELRTPIAGLLSTLEVTLSRMRSPEEYRESFGECFEIAKRMSWLVSNLLSVARLESGNVQLQHRELEIEPRLREWWKPFEARAAERRLQVEWQVHPGARVTTDPEFLRVVLTNLFDNAVSHAPEQASIRIDVTPRGSISIANPAVGLNPESLRRAFDPFWRNPPSGPGETVHAGLGLSLCRKIIELLGGRICAWIREHDGQFVVQLDLA